MNTAKRCFALTLVVLVSVSMMGCFDQVVEPEYDGPPKVQFDPTSNSVPDGAGAQELNIQLIAPQQSSDSQFPVTVVDTGDIATTLPSDEYELVSETATIPAGSSFGTVQVRVDSSGIPPGETQLLTLALEESSNSDIVPATNFQFFELTVAGRSADVRPEPASLSFDTIEAGSTARDTLAVVNEGTAPSDVSNLAVSGMDAGRFSIEAPAGDSFTLPPGESQEVVVDFAPEGTLSDTTDYAGSVDFQFTNVPDGPGEASAELTGTGIPQP
ncbi:hypothetical protein [Salinibacter grassmerensis]|uniref:hypothetical protein n=1 Tax=Salinibacter grassmerensis TaxID=3040353 RepID=UPI0021E8E8C0|nr:hypothetical protein [Salinibacter grassmerensis]